MVVAVVRSDAFSSFIVSSLFIVLLLPLFVWHLIRDIVPCGTYFAGEKSAGYFT